MKNNDSNTNTRRLLVLTGLLLPVFSFSQEKIVPQTGSYFFNPLFNTLLAIIILLFIMIAILGGALKNVMDANLYGEKLKQDKKQVKSGPPTLTVFVVFFMFMNITVFSQNEVAVVIKDDRISGLDQFVFYTMIVIIGIELLVLGVLFSTFKTILGINKPAIRSLAETRPKTKTMLDKLNGTVEIEKEESILLDHSYDGIKELDNNLPPWWKYGFYLTILIAIVYMVNYHITRTAPLQKEEYTNSIKKAEVEVAEYMKNSANNVDENTVKLLTDVDNIANGKDLFVSTCAACHGKLGEGGVGPNLTDAYWLHGGSVKDIFKTIKYGWPDKGMKSWKEDLSPVQIAQISSFIRSIQGTSPPKAKDKQGELYIEQIAPSDSTGIKEDSTKALAAGLHR